MDFFSGDYISALRGCCALKFLHVLEIHQGLLAHTPNGAGVPPPKKNNRENLKFALKFSVLRSITSGLVAVSSRDFTSVDVPRGRGDNLGTIFCKAHPQKFLTAKNHPKFGAIFDNLWLWSRISPERINISKIGKTLENLQPLPRSTKKSWCTLVHKRKSYWP